MKLYFLRHGIAFEADAWHGSDFDRPLTAEGSKKLAREAKTIAQLELEVDCILSSPLVRAKQTANIVAAACKPAKSVIEDSRLGGGFGSAALVGILRDHTDARAILLVGHEPGMSHTIADLTGAHLDFKKGMLACVELSSFESIRGALVWLLPAKFLTLKGAEV